MSAPPGTRDPACGPWPAPAFVLVHFCHGPWSEMIILLTRLVPITPWAQGQAGAGQGH